MGSDCAGQRVGAMKLSLLISELQKVLECEGDIEAHAFECGTEKAFPIESLTVCDEKLDSYEDKRAEGGDCAPIFKACKPYLVIEP